MISVDSARRLLDFSGRIAPDIAAGQLIGAVALHNILERERVAYLADEVGMGKTLVALGTLALFRHWNPDFRALILAPRENIQKKWGKEFRQFARNNVKVRDLRVRALHDAPARTLVHCTDLLHLVRETVLDPDRDFIARLTSFSLAFGSSEAMKKKRELLLQELPWLDPAWLDLRDKEAFQDNFARAVCCLLPSFDLLIVDEGHNLKHGVASRAVRNRVLRLAFGASPGDGARGFPAYGPRVQRLLILSATPVENDYRQLWNQLDIFGKAEGFMTLADRDASPDAKRECARRILIRRITSLSAAGQTLTKNIYRREWRAGGVHLHDQALEVPDHKRRLVVALVQKKVSEALQSPRFNNNFQIGMLASFESFLETVGLATTDETETPSNFDQSEQTADELERLGADVRAINRLARDYRRKFGTELPHPKMDSVVDGLADSFQTGEKALVFVRRVASVRELKRKLDERYDRYLLERLRRDLKPEVMAELLPAFDRYREERRVDIERGARAGGGENAAPSDTARADEGGSDSFFAWFFRGEGPPDVFSGPTLQRRFGQASAALSTFFEDNWVAWLLGVEPAEAPARLSAYLSEPWDVLDGRMRESVARWLASGRQAERKNYFLGFQRAALEELSRAERPLAIPARVILDSRFDQASGRTAARKEAPAARDWLSTRTLFTALRAQPDLYAALPIDYAISGVKLWDEVGQTAADLATRFRNREMRRELLSALCRLGHASIDLWTLVANHLGTLRRGARAAADDDGFLIGAFLETLSRQKSEPNGFRAYHEIHAALLHFGLLLDVNAPDIRTARLDELTESFGRLLREQQPVGGMSGRVNETLVRQFRMPGYPLVLVSTDLLQEGEDLHTFCSSVYHYGISWMPSSMEQRTGRIDRVNSATQRRLGLLKQLPVGDELLQVYYPHLRETVEVLQVDRVLERMAQFVQLMHKDLIVPREEEKRIDLTREVLRQPRSYGPSDAQLKTAFDVMPEMLQGDDIPLAVDASAAETLYARFAGFRALVSHADIEWRDTAAEQGLIGVRTIQDRTQPFALFLRTAGGRPIVRCVSPVGHIAGHLWRLLEGWETRSAVARVATVREPDAGTYNVAVEGDVLLGGSASDAERVLELVTRITQEADELEAELLASDDRSDTTMTTLRGEAADER